MNGLAFVIAFILFVGGILLFGYAFDAGEQLRAIVFVGGLVAITLSVAIPFHLLKRTDR
ncbi:MAG: hypothetical protein JWR36_686 [Glaciihabitans sp.]|jgi:hypothetical protein|nr:hypothetical protein [Glaciihabitans sp.]MDQ1572203.1 hypothetical protein [Actinomycetota bacterium]